MIGCLIVAYSISHWMLPSLVLAGEAAVEVVRTRSSGVWSSPDVWVGNRLPAAGARVLIEPGHEVTFDLEDSPVLRGVHVAGVLTFDRGRDTCLNVGMLRIDPSTTYLEDGFDCHHSLDDNKTQPAGHGHIASSRPALFVGTAERPIPAGHSARIRLHAIEGQNPEFFPAVVCCGGWMELHGAPLQRTWVKLRRTADVGSNRLFLAETVPGWKAGDQLIITGTSRQEFVAGTTAEHVSEQPTTEVRRIVSLGEEGRRQSGMLSGSPQVLTLDAPLTRLHLGTEEFSGEVANLSRNVVVESADPAGARGHTMYHHGSSGSISYAEFRHLGKRGVLGKYPIHFHLVGDTMRGSSVVGASIWDSQNRWVTIHGTRYLVVRDCVGYQSIGHGFFLEDGTGTHNVLDRNLAVQAMIGAALPQQVLSYDRNDGAGFWWANSLNVFTRNVAAECDQHGFRYEVEKTAAFDPVLPIEQPDGSTKRIDIRTLPFIRFEDNEAHCQRRFGLNLGGIRGMTHAELRRKGDYGDVAHSIGGTVGGVGPDGAHPFVIRNFKVWDTHWGFHAGAPSVHVDGFTAYECNYGMWRSTIDLHQYDNLSFRRMHAHAIFFPTGGHGPDIHLEEGKPSFPETNPKDDFPPFSVITHVELLPAVNSKTGSSANEMTSAHEGTAAAHGEGGHHAGKGGQGAPTEMRVRVRGVAFDNAGAVR
jgi:hypothetical protein